MRKILCGHHLGEYRKLYSSRTGREVTKICYVCARDDNKVKEYAEQAELDMIGWRAYGSYNGVSKFYKRSRRYDVFFNLEKEQYAVQVFYDKERVGWSKLNNEVIIEANNMVEACIRADDMIINQSIGVL